MTSYSKRKWPLIQTRLVPTLNSCSSSFTLALISPSYLVGQVPPSSSDRTGLGLPPDVDFRYLQRIAFLSYLWVMDLQISQFPLLMLVFSLIVPWFIYSSVPEDTSRIMGPSLCVNSFFRVSAVHNRLGRSSLGIPLVILFECFRNECFLILEGLHDLISLVPESD